MTSPDVLSTSGTASRCRARQGATIDRARLYATSAGINQLHLNGAGRRRHAAGTGVVHLRPAPPVRDARRHRARRAGRERDRRRRRRRLVARVPRLGHEAQRLRRPPRPARATRDHALRRHGGDDRHRRDVADLGRSRCCAPTSTTASPSTRASHMDGWYRAGFDDSAWSRAETFAPAVGRLVARRGPPVRRTQELPVREVIVTPSGRTLLDFGQNLVGWVRFTVDGPAGTVVTLRHAEVLEDGELGTRPLRNAEATDRYTLRGDGPETWEPTFTFHGFRYAEVDGWPGAELDPDRLHRRRDPLRLRAHGNVLVLATSCSSGSTRTSCGACAATSSTCPPTARSATSASAGPATSRCSPRPRPSCSTSAGFLADWLDDLRAEQHDNGAMPLYVPDARAGWPVGDRVRRRGVG